MKILIFVLLCLPLSARTQQLADTAHKSIAHTVPSDWELLTDSTHKVRSYFTAGVQYLSDNVYRGRKDSARIPYLSPTLAYYHKSGLYAEATASLLMSTGNTRIDAGTFTGGYMYAIGENFNGDISASKYLYNSQSQNVQSEVKGNLDASGTYDFGEVISATLDATVNFGKTNDYGASFSLDHTFYMLNDHLRIDPTITANAGTEHYYDAYYNLRRLNKQRVKKGKNTVVADIHDASAFHIQDYEYSAMIFYTIGKKLTLSFNPTYATPVHPAVITLTTPATGNSVTRTESLSNQFYWSSGITWKF